MVAETAAPTTAVQFQTRNVIRTDDLRVWLAEHGLDIDEVFEATIRIERRRDQLGAWLDVAWYKRNGSGRRYVDGLRCLDGDEAASGHSTIPLRSWPKLTAVDPAAEPS